MNDPSAKTLGTRERSLENNGNIKVGSSDLVLGAYGSNNYHSSGIVAVFNCGVELVRLFDTDNDPSKKTLFAFNEYGKLIGKTHTTFQTTFQIDTSMTGGQLIHKIEIDSRMGTLVGSAHFTIDNFYVEGESCGVPQIETCSDSVSLKFTGLEEFYRVGDNIVIDLIENLEVSNRFERVDLWVVIEIPTGDLLFKTPLALTPFSFSPQPFKSSLEVSEAKHRILEFEVIPGLGGDYKFYALYVQEGKNPMIDFFPVYRSNIAVARTTLANE